LGFRLDVDCGRTDHRRERATRRFWEQVAAGSACPRATNPLLPNQVRRLPHDDRPGGPMSPRPGPLTQVGSESKYTVVLTLTANAGQTDYPELKCGGKLTRIGASHSYVFFVEVITSGQADKGAAVRMGPSQWRARVTTSIGRGSAFLRII
jgi:hypothetical protein